MKGKYRLHRVGAWACTGALVLSLLPVPSLAAQTPAVSSNIHKNNYTTWSAPVTSYLYENEAGGLTRVEYTGGQVVIEDYGADFSFLSSRTISLELPLWGGFYAGESYNFLIFGQKNPSESSATEVIRVVKYDKDWNRLGAASLKGANTTVPFDAGSLRCDEYGGYLYIRTSHEMYTSDDGLNHQSNLTLAVRQSDMSITDSFYDVMNISYGYVSHSFNQFILVDQEGKIIALDHGDAYPRSAVLVGYYSNASTGKFSGSRYSNWCWNMDLITFDGSIGDNTTGGSVGGLAETADGYVMTYNYDGVGGGGERSIYFQYMDKATGKGRQYMLNGSAGSTTPMLAPTGLDGGYVLWNGRSGYTTDNTLHYIPYAADGTPSNPLTASAPLSDCQPIPYDGGVVWYVTDNSVPTFYVLDDSGVTSYPVGDSSQPEPEPTPGSFSDVPSNAWYAQYAQEAAQAGLMTGTGGSSFSPNTTLSTAEVVTLAARLHADRNGKTVPQSSGAWYQGAYDYCLDNGLFTRTEIPQSSLTGTATRYQMVDLLDRAVPDSEKQAVKTISDGYIPDLRQSDPYGDVVYQWYRAGIVEGDSAHRFNGSTHISRAETAAILCRLAGLTPRV